MKSTVLQLRNLWHHREHARVILRRSLFTPFRYDGMSKLQTVVFDVRFILVCTRHIQSNEVRA